MGSGSQEAPETLISKAENSVEVFIEVLRRVRESEVRAREEAALWKRLYEQEKAASVREEEVDLQASYWNTSELGCEEDVQTPTTPPHRDEGDDSPAPCTPSDLAARPELPSSATRPAGHGPAAEGLVIPAVHSVARLDAAPCSPSAGPRAPPGEGGDVLGHLPSELSRGLPRDSVTVRTNGAGSGAERGLRSARVDSIVVEARPLGSSQHAQHPRAGTEGHMHASYSMDSFMKKSLSAANLWAVPPGERAAASQTEGRRGSKGGSPGIVLTDDGAAGVGVTAAAAQAMAAARAWALFTHESRSQVHRRPSLPGRVAYQLEALLSTRQERMDDSTSVQSAASSRSILPPLAGPRPSLSLRWLNQPQTVLVIAKQSPEVMNQLLRVVVWLKKRGLLVFVEPDPYKELLHMASRCTSQLDGAEDLGENCDVLNKAMVQELIASLCGDTPGRLVTWSCEECGGDGSRPFREVIDNIDFIITLGGDGTVLWTASMFKDAPAPPMISFAMGSLGFMTPFPFDHFEPVLEGALTGDIPILVRHRLHARIRRSAQNKDMGEPECEVLNEVVIDRGPHPYLTNLVCNCDGSFVTRVQGDGLIVATPSGSTAYSLAAGGAMVHPTVPCMLFTPICPHSLSFRPVIFPEHISLRIDVPPDARAEVYCSFDGKDRQALHPGDSIKIHLSRYPVPVVCNMDATHDWFLTVRDTLHWNRRKEQSGRDHKLASKHGQ